MSLLVEEICVADLLSSIFPASPLPKEFLGCLKMPDVAGDVLPPAVRRRLNPPGVKSPEVASWRPEVVERSPGPGRKDLNLNNWTD